MILNEKYTLSNGVEIPKLGLGTRSPMPILILQSQTKIWKHSSILKR